VLSGSIQKPRTDVENLEIDKLRKSLDSDENEDFDFNVIKSRSLESDKKTDKQLYKEIFIDEINHTLLNNINKCEGPIVDVLMNSERVSSFEELWKNTFEEHYRDISRKEKLSEIKAKHLKKKAETA